MARTHVFWSFYGLSKVESILFLFFLLIFLVKTSAEMFVVRILL